LVPDALQFSARSYPPKGDNGLYQLHYQVCESDRSDHQKLSVFYYMLLDFNEHLSLKSRINFAELFASRFGLPKKYVIFMRGLWHLDRKELSVRLCNLQIISMRLTNMCSRMRFKISHTPPSTPNSPTI
jgi:hypothetical protein